MNGGTKVTHDMMAGSDSAITALIFACLGPFIRPMMRKRLLKELRTMGDAIRANASPT